jgi:hypothetical protein
MKDLKSPLFVLSTKAKAPPASSKFSKNEWIIRFMKKTAIESNIIGAEQYTIRHKVCMTPL